MPGQVIAYVRPRLHHRPEPERQKVAIRTAVGVEPEHWFTDRASGGSTDRPTLEAMLAHVRDQDTVVVASMDRLARSVVDLDRLVSELTARGLEVRFLKEGLTFNVAGPADPLAVFQLQVMGAFAQLERALIRDRQREGHRGRQGSRGLPGPSPPAYPGTSGRSEGRGRLRGPEGRGGPSARRGPPDRLQRIGDGQAIDGREALTQSWPVRGTRVPGPVRSRHGLARGRVAGDRAAGPVPGDEWTRLCLDGTVPEGPRPARRHLTGRCATVVACSACWGSSADSRW